MRIETRNGDPIRRKLVFDCPRNPGKECWVMLKPWPISDGKTWTLEEGTEAAPTLSPSINCSGCGWHGHVKAGQLHPPK